MTISGHPHYELVYLNLNGFFLYLNVSGVVDYAQLLDSAIAIGYV